MAKSHGDAMASSLICRDNPNQQPGMMRGMKTSADVVVGRWTHACNMNVMACRAISGGGNHTEKLSRSVLAIH